MMRIVPSMEVKKNRTHIYQTRMKKMSWRKIKMTMKTRRRLTRLTI